jgi:hypothetical protein
LEVYIIETVGFEVLTAMVVKSTVFWDNMPCSPLKVDQHFGETHYKQSSAPYLLHAGFLLGLFFDPEDGGNMFL